MFWTTSNAINRYSLMVQRLDNINPFITEVGLPFGAIMSLRVYCSLWLTGSEHAARASLRVRRQSREYSSIPR
jgi:hypothetical protein